MHDDGKQKAHATKLTLIVIFILLWVVAIYLVQYYRFIYQTNNGKIRYSPEACKHMPLYRRVPLPPVTSCGCEFALFCSNDGFFFCLGCVFVSSDTSVSRAFWSANCARRGAALFFFLCSTEGSPHRSMRSPEERRQPSMRQRRRRRQRLRLAQDSASNDDARQQQSVRLSY